MKKPVYVTQPALPPFEDFTDMLKQVWDSKVLTNNGPFHRQFEAAVAEYLGVRHISLFSNGTLALMTALQALRISGEVITTPYSFVATTHSLWWNNITPVFADIDPVTFNLSPEKAEAAITPRTTAIMPVHVYGTPCVVDAFQNLADTYGLRLIYDAAHAFGVTLKGQSVLNFGDLSVLSFHATKVFNTFEGGAIVCHDEKTKKHIDYLKNFGFANETTVIEPGINAKMNEIQSITGLLQLKHIDEYIRQRADVVREYRSRLAGLPGISFPQDLPDIRPNYAYFPIFIDRSVYGRSRDDLYEFLKQNEIFGRRYFYPLISDFPMYRGLPSAGAGKLPVAKDVAERVICLPLYPHLETDSIHEICELIAGFRD